MRVLSIRPIEHNSAGNLTCIARFDIELQDEVRVKDCSLLWSERDQDHLIYGPRNGSHGRLITFGPQLREEIREAALAALDAN